MLVIRLNHRIAHILVFTANDHLARLITAGAQDGAAQSQNARQRRFIQEDAAVLQQSAETVVKANQLQVVAVFR
jgi:phospholipase/lecithinase/hemolysin